MTSEGRVDTYLVVAAKCIELAQLTNDTRNKLSLLDMARAWLALAEQGSPRPLGRMAPAKIHNDTAS
jgi:hypothetical protein